MISIYQPYKIKESAKYVDDAIQSSYISSFGKYKELAENKLKEILGCKYALLTNNGTTATHLVAKSLKFKYPNLQSIIVPTNVYVAAWNSFLYDKDWILYPVDANIDTWNIETENIVQYENTALLIVHNLGNIINVPKLQQQYQHLPIVEDNCEGLFGRYNGQLSGTASIASSISFYGNKSITCGEGGAFITNNEDIYLYAKQLHGQGQGKIRYIHDMIGYNYRMTNVQAAILYSQLEMYQEIIERKKEIFEYFRKKFTELDIIHQKIDPSTEHSNWMFAVRIKGSKGFDDVEKFMLAKGIEIRPMFYPMSAHTHLKDIANKQNEINAAILNKECIMLPSYPELTKEDQDSIINGIFEYTKTL